MVGSVLVEMLRRHWRQALFWGLGIGALTFLQIIVLPDVDALQQLAELMETVPPAFAQMFGLNDTQYLATPEGYVATRTFGLLLLLVSIYAIVAGLNVTANDEERGVMDNVLALPISRWQLVLEKLLAYALMSIFVVVVICLLTILAVTLTPALGIDMGKIVLGSVNVLPGMLVVLAFTALVGTVVRSKGLATALAVLFLVGSYFIDTLGRDAANSFVAGLRAISFHSYYDGTNVLRFGFNAGNFTLLLIVALILAILSLAAYQRRDIGV
ncbi:MAG: ABC transporter permease subunit [Chloroflexota bacterium]|nr:ABC transporter permease subunit [Chloroflexota bacterium]